MSARTNRETPGVFINELDAFPPSVVGVATAVPAFVGYTEKAEVAGKPVFRTAIQVASLAEFEATFGGPASTDVQLAPASVPPFVLHSCLRLFYANGGGACYVVSAGPYAAGGVTADDLTAGLGVLAEAVGPTMLVVPDAVNLPADEPASATPWVSSAFRTVVRAMLEQCGSRQDRVAILDVYGTQHATADNWQAVIERFRADVGDQGLSYGAAYFPFLLGTSQSVADALLPPSGALAGVYTAVDAEQGVWNAPANIALVAVNGVSFPLTDAQQGSLNVPTDGRAVDAIRVFTGRGAVVWGARTLAGNSEYRYIQVRRTLIYVEQSIRQVLQQFVFAANDGQTWTAVIATVSNFLQDLWSQGGLFGATADEAFRVQCGLGTTMTAQDILDGYLIVQVTLQLVRPAEFIELTFQQKLEGLG